MKTPATFLLGVLLIAACDKTEEKRGGVSATPKQEERLKPSTAPPSEAAPVPAPEKPVPQSAELDAFYADVDALQKKAEPVLKNPETKLDSPEVADLEATCDQLMKRRSQLISGFAPNQRKEVAKRSVAVSKVLNALMGMRLGTPTAVPDPGRAPEAQTPASGDPAAPQGNENEAPASRRNRPVVPQ